MNYLGYNNMSPMQGVLPYQHIKDLIKKSHITADHEIPDGNIQPASLDLRLGDTCWLLGRTHYSDSVKNMISGALEEYDASKGFLVHPGSVYLAEIQETMHLPETVRAYANPKSTTGRCDHLARLITEATHDSLPHNPVYDTIPLQYDGKLYVEITPQSFYTKMFKGLPLNQIRFYNGDAHLNENGLRILHKKFPLVYDQKGKPTDELRISGKEGTSKAGVDLTLDLKHGKDGVIGYKAKKDANAVLTMHPDRLVAHEKRIDSNLLFEPIPVPKDGKLVLEENTFYILSTNEFVRVPYDLCATIASYEATLGEFRNHYAGFFDPGFGMFSIRDKKKQYHALTSKSRGSPATLEMRVLGKSIRMQHGQPICRVIFESLCNEPEKIYGLIENKQSINNYAHQRGATLPKYCK